MNILAYLAMVDVDMYHLCLSGIGLQAARHTIAEAHTYGYEHVTFLLFYVWSIVAVHTQHSHIQRMAVGQGRQAQHGASGWYVAFLQECGKLLLRITQLHALPYQCKRLLGRVYESRSFVYGSIIECR